MKLRAGRATFVVTPRTMSTFDAIHRDVAEFLAKNYDLALDTLAPEAKLEDLGFDSLGMFSVVTLLENRHGLKFDSTLMTRVKTVGDLLDIVRAQSSGGG